MRERGASEKQKKKNGPPSFLPRAACQRRLFKYAPTRKASGGPGERTPASRSASLGCLAPLFISEELFIFLFEVRSFLFFHCLRGRKKESKKGKDSCFSSYYFFTSLTLIAAQLCPFKNYSWE